MERDLADKLYMTWEQVQELSNAGVEIGAHTRTHAILSTVSAEENLYEIDGSARAIEERLGHAPEVFAYPFGRSWDYGEDAKVAVSAAGCRYAVITHSGWNTAETNPLELRCVPVEESTGNYWLVGRRYT